MKALVTGGGGFLGSRLAQMLHERGDDVLVLGRRRYSHHEEAGIATVQADITNAAAVVRACEGMDAVFHVAALAGIWGKRRAFRETNVVGTRNVITACREVSVGRLIYTSSPSVVFGSGDLCGVDESAPYPAKYLAHYPATKAEAEKAVLAANDGSLATIALRPHLIWGPGDPHLIPRVIERARRGRLVQVGDGTNLADITYIDNAADAHVLACDVLAIGARCSGRAYFISQGEPVSLWPWLASILKAVGAPAACRTVSFRAAFTVGAVLEALYGSARISREPKMTRFLASQLAKSHYFNIFAARDDLGYEPRVSIDEGVERLVESLG